jgi:hypothetical protein
MTTEASGTSELRGANWPTLNQAYLSSELNRIQGRLQLCLTGKPNPDDVAETVMRPADMDRPPALVTLCDTFGLSGFERDIVLLCAGVEMDAGFARACAMAQNDPQLLNPTFGLALKALSEGHWSALLPNAPLRDWQIIHIGEGRTLTLSPLRLDERILHYLNGLQYPDARLTGILSWEEAQRATLPAHRELSERIAAAWMQSDAGVELPLIQLVGPDCAERQAIASAVCARLGLQLAVLPLRSLPAALQEGEMLRRLWEREAVLSAGALLLETEDDSEEARSREATFEHIAQKTQGLVFVSTRERRPFPLRVALNFEIERPDAVAQAVLWQQALPFLSPALTTRLGPLAAQFRLGALAIESVAVQVRGLLCREEELPEALWNACRSHARPRLEALAQAVRVVAAWEDLVLPAPQEATLHEIAAHVRQRHRVYTQWGFSEHGTRGSGITALFAGSSGTGKTLAAEVLAGELRLDLFRIDLSSVVSKYIGETEKNLRQLFDAAEESGAILLFDEADALFGKRSEVKDSHDRYANIEVSYLLQRMEAYSGLAILTTNLKNALDTAFLRRLRFVVPFPFPDAAQRTVIWQRVFPLGVPVEGLDYEKLARLNIAGGNIRNIAMNAAFLAADGGDCVRMQHLLQAARSEYAKLEKPLTDSEIAGWLFSHEAQS